jgi:hypothetical protein
MGNAKKSAFILLPQSQNNCIVCEPCLAVYRSGWELRTQLGHSISFALTVYFLFPPPHLSIDMGQEL